MSNVNIGKDYGCSDSIVALYDGLKNINNINIDASKYRTEYTYLCLIRFSQTYRTIDKKNVIFFLYWALIAIQVAKRYFKHNKYIFIVYCTRYTLSIQYVIRL